MRHLAVFALTLSAAPVVAQTLDAAPVVAAERAFAVDAALLGVAGSFNKWSTPDAIVIGGGQVQRVVDAYPVGPRRADEPTLAWWPNFAGVARSGDMGFTTGGVAVNGRRTGHYFTIWARQADGAWKWIYDGGSGASAAGVPGPDSEPVILQVSSAGSASPAAAMEEVRAAEARLAERAATDQKLAHLAELAADGRVYVAPRAPAVGVEAATEALGGWPDAFRFGPPDGGGASEAGDMAWTYGAAAWTHDEQERRGHYVRLWQKRERGWVLVLAQLIPAPPPQAPPAAN